MNLLPLCVPGPLRVLFVMTEMTVGGEEMVTLEVLRRLNRDRFTPVLACLKELGECGEAAIAAGVPAYWRLIRHKYDATVVRKLVAIIDKHQIDAVVTVGTGGDKMFWGRLAAMWRKVPVIASAIHSTGYPLRVGRLNRLLTPWTDAFIAVASAHGRYIIEREGCPADRVTVIPNGVDIHRFQPRPADPELRRSLGIPADAPVCGLVAVIREEKNHELWLRVARRVRESVPAAHFLLVGGGPELPRFEALARELGLGECVHFTGRRMDTPELLNQMDVFLLTSKMEANPVSILEAGACGKPVVATRVGSIPETVLDGRTGFITDRFDEAGLAERVSLLLATSSDAILFGRAAREHVVANYSVEAMVRGYEDLLAGIYERKTGQPSSPPSPQTTEQELVEVR